ncbi:hypothetical protein D9Q98_004759 [Chlorella vulgaris]|uniref:Uncharacterized protein n=1 Tax=Chlorella vulgaris TaxID=3077 RepID=A0A9D4YXU2_CHLVU|nr:hypothetical protein D9Q98_004759 [Chlorella vulgaris]
MEEDPTPPRRSKAARQPVEPRGLAYGPSRTYPLPKELNLQNTNIVLTGGTSGLGLEAAKTLCAKNASVYLLGKSLERGQRSVQTFASAFKALGVPLHVLVLNAGTFLRQYSKSADGYEQTVATNYLGHFLLAHLLLPELQAATPSRIVWQGSVFEQLGRVKWDDLGGQFARDSDLWQYADSKLMCMMAAREMAKRLKVLILTWASAAAAAPGLRWHSACHADAYKPGSWIYWAVARVLGQSPARGAYSLLYAAATPELDGKGGEYIGPPYLGLLALSSFNTSRITPLNPAAHSAFKCRQLYEATARLLEEKMGRLLPNRLPAIYREHPWRESVAGRDRAQPVDASLDPRTPSYHTHRMVQHVTDAVRRGGATSGSVRAGA